MIARPRAARIAVPGAFSLARRCLQMSAVRRAASEPLRILFCGSDGFSCQSLKALHREHVQNPGLVESVDVMVRPPKRAGRGLKQLRQVPCKALADTLGLKVHERDTFRQWQLPGEINLIVAVSFGLFVPPRILESSKYGGLNVHPSLLPDLRGPAPIHWSLLRGDSHVGVSLQTLDPKSFDHGTILAQTPSPGLPVPAHSSPAQLTEMLGEAGAEMLVQGLRDGVHIPPWRDAGWAAEAMTGRALTHAPKVTKADARVDWATWTVDNLQRRIRVLGSAWSYAAHEKTGVVKRVLFLDAEPVAAADVPEQIGSATITFANDGEDTRVEGDRHSMRVAVDAAAASGHCYLEMHEGNWARVSRVKVDGKPEQAAAMALKPFFLA